MGKMLDDWQIGSGSAKLCLCRKEGRNLLLELCASVLAPSNVDDCHGLLLRLICSLKGNDSLVMAEMPR